MQGRPDRIEAGLEQMAAEVAGLAARVARLSARVAALEQGLPPMVAAPGVLPDPLTPASAPGVDEVEALTGRGAAQEEAVDPVSLLTPAGRTCLVLGGAYLLRALTEAGRLPLNTGIALGFLYALAWLVAADRAALRRPVSGTFHALAGVLIGLPIVWEASTRFGLLSPGWSAAAVAIFVAAAFAVARHRSLPALAGAAALGATGLALVLAVATGVLLPNAVLLIGIAAVAWALSDAARWPWLKWPPALASVIAMGGLWLRTGRNPPLDAPAGVLAAAVLLIGTTLLLVARRIRRHEAVRVFDAAQTLLVLVTGLGAGAAAAGHLGPDVAGSLALFTLLLGALAYGAAFLLLRLRPVEARSVHYCAVLGLLLLVFATSRLFSGAARDIAFTALALATAWLGARGVQVVFAAHSAVFAVAAAATSGLVACSTAIWLARPAHWPAFPLTGAVVLVAALPGGLIPRRAPSRALEIAASMSRLVLALVLVATAGSLIVLAAGPLVAGTPPDPGRLASLKTIVLSAAAVALALVARLPFGGELGWLAYPALGAGGVKIVIEDFRVSTASMLFVALAVYGTALILTSRIRRTRPALRPAS
ncbi:MAG TPA: hypothetical protein VGS03_16315 [Candidatus Polarisedimenticolia bacterium]|nr:hypothetical protein [Candidatus Polarisedimenticolia bacterium]